MNYCEKHFILLLEREMSSLLSWQFSQMISTVPEIPFIIFTQDLFIFITFHLVILKHDF